MLRFLSPIIILLTALSAAAAINVPWPERNVWPESPQAKSIRQVMMPSAGLLTGACEVSVPLYTIEVEGLKIPVSLQYRSNGIRVDDEPQPIGYGWVLTPPLRISRQIMGRPDECCNFIAEDGRESIDGSESDDRLYMKAYGCVTDTGLENPDFHNELYDTEYDIYTVYLPDATLTMVYKDGTLKGVNCDEYKVECGERLSSIKVTDPTGIIYKFTEKGEFVDLSTMLSEWMLTSITLQSGTEIKIDWESWSHTAVRNNTYEPKTIYYEPGDYTYEHPSGEMKPSHKFYNSKSLKSITFPGGKLICNYTTSGDKMLSEVTVSNDSKKIFSAVMDRTQDHRLLTGVTLNGDETYSFGYNSGKISNAASADWWGYHNGANNNGIITPAVSMKGLDGSGSFHGAYRNVNAETMKANILIKVKYPTGGSAEWEYEPHSFAPQKAPAWVNAYLKNEVTFSEGGGLRVKKITLKENDNDPAPQIRTYTYGENENGLAEIEAVPFLHTFISESGILLYKYHYGQAVFSVDNCMVINRSSDYLYGMPGVIPIWYRQVTETDSEGKTEYRFENFCEPNITDRGWGYVMPVEIYSAFSKGPQLVSTTKYKQDGTGYKAIEKETITYKSVTSPDMDVLNSFTVRRELLFLYNDEYAPDFGPFESQLLECLDFLGESNKEDSEMGGAPPLVAFRNQYCWYEGYDYQIYPSTELLTGKKTTRYFDNGEMTVTERYEYRPNTSVRTREVTVCGTDSVVTDYSYTDKYSPTVAADLQSRNICGMVTGVSQTFGNATTSYDSELSRTAIVFWPKRIWQRRGGAAWSESEYVFNHKGFLISQTTADDVKRSWTRDSYGNPLTMTEGKADLTSTAVWEHLVGVTSLTDPAGTKKEFGYDAAGRLIGVRLNNRLLENYSYNYSQEGKSSVTATKYMLYLAGVGISYFTTTKYDGLGRPWATVSQHSSGAYATTITEYDAMGRKSSDWAPVSVADGASAAEIKSASLSYYGDEYACSTTEYEPSQRGLPVRTTRSGSAWHTAGKSVQTSLATNDSRSYVCPRYTVGTSGVVSAGNYPTGTLTVEKVTDEDGVTIENYKDFLGRNVCRKENGLVTSYVYDDYGDLRYILPPGLSGTRSRTDGAMKNLAFWYDYDSRGRLSVKKLPGVAEARSLYDPAGRLAAEHSGHHAQGEWRFYGYDSVGRQVLAADCAIGEAEAVTFASACRTAELSSSGIYSGYSIGGFPQQATVVWAKYYDNYDFITSLGLPDEFKWVNPGGTANFGNAHGSPTGKMTGMYTGQGYESYHYNVDGQISQRYATGFNRGRTDTSYSYDGQVISTKTTHPADTLPEKNITNVYDQYGHLVSVKAVQRGATADSVVMTNSYNALGQISSVKFGNVRTDFSYDVHGWLKSSSTAAAGGKRLFENLSYAEGTSPRYNGNVSEKQWHGGVYRYGYDGNNRLVTAESVASDGSDYSTAYSYDSRGNVTSILRKGIADRAGATKVFGTLDDITLGYDGNRISTVTSQTDAVPFEGQTGLGRNGSDMAVSYDSNGRLTYDETRGIDEIEYSNDGMPVRIRFRSGREQHDEWDALGNHLSTSYYSPDASGALQLNSRKEYTGDGIVTVDGAVTQSRIPGGYFSGGKAYRYISDYQGNNVAVTDTDGNIVQQTDYYPYGEPWTEPSGQPYLYSDNERLRLDGLNEYDFHARRLNSSLLSFSVWDPYAEKYPWLSPYGYCAGNPVMLTDKKGKVIDTLWDIAFIAYDTTSALYYHATGDHGKAKESWASVGFDVAAALIPGVPAGINKIGKALKATEESVIKVSSKMKHADAIREGKAFEEKMFQEALESGRDVQRHVTIVTKDGKRSVVDMLERNADGTFTVHEFKLRSTTKLSKGQNGVKKAVGTDGAYVELRSSIGEWGKSKREPIFIKDFQRHNKYPTEIIIE